MGHRKYSAPRRGSLSYSPRKRSARLLPSIRYWPRRADGVSLEGFIAYKAGMTSVYYIDDVPGSPTQGTEVQAAATILAAPPMHVIGLVLYGDDGYGGLRELSRIYAGDLPAWVRDRVRGVGRGAGGGDLSSLLDGAREVRAVVASVPREAGLPQKRPFILEVKVSGGVREAYEYVSSRLGQRISIEEFIQPGRFVDVVGVTRGQGFQGVVKRFGIKILPRKQRKTRRAVAAIGGRKPPYVTRFVPRAGQMGFHRRTEYNKRVLGIFPDGEKLTPRGGLRRFGVIRSPCVLIQGSVAGTPKRPLVLREPARPPRYRLGQPKIAAITHGEEVLAA